MLPSKVSVTHQHSKGQNTVSIPRSRSRHQSDDDPPGRAVTCADQGVR